MRNEYFLNVMRMLQSQLKEEEENYEKALKIVHWKSGNLY